MASINGVTIRGLKNFYGHDGETLYQGNVYYNGKSSAFGRRIHTAEAIASILTHL